MSRKLARYQNEVIIDHLASNYVLGTLTTPVRRRLERLRQLPQYQQLAQRVIYWENKLVPLLDDVPELPPKDTVWDNLQAGIGASDRLDESASDVLPQTARAWSNWLFGSFSLSRFVTACSLLVALVLGYFQFQEDTPLGALSYVAVLSDENQNPQVVAATYGESQLLMLEILDLPDIDEQQSFELWVTSKTDKQTRSLGVIPADAETLTRPLTIAEWRLIKDSDSLLITIEEYGGSSIGSPMGDTVSTGLCIQLSQWQET